MINVTPLVSLLSRRRAHRVDFWDTHSDDIQRRQLRWLLFRGATTEYGHAHNFEKALRNEDPRQAFAEIVPMCDYEEIRPLVMRMIDGEKDILWPGICRNFAQSSGTSGGRSKYIPITPDSLRVNHYGASADVVAQYLRYVPDSRILSGKALILGGSFDNQLKIDNPDVRVGDLSATLIDRIPSFANFYRIPDKKTALLSDWHVKLDRLAQAAVKENITNLSGVPSWFMRVILRALEISGASNASELWPNLEVFFHGGISFEPYRAEYSRLTNPAKMHFFETYNASEGFFATQASLDNSPGMLLLIDRGIYFEFLPLGASPEQAIGISDVKPGKIYELVITAPNGLWRYRIGDTVEIVSTDPVRIRVAGRTKSFINAFGEELMEDNAERAISAACHATGANIANYTAGPVYAHDKQRGRHQWAIEWRHAPDDITRFRDILDSTLKKLNSDYAAKREGGIFLDPPEILSLPKGTFDQWLASNGSGKLGGQRKIPRLRNDRSILDPICRISQIQSAWT